MTNVINTLVGAVLGAAVTFALMAYYDGNALGGTTNFDTLAADSIQATGAISGASASLSGTGTTTVSIHTSTSGRGSCLELESTTGTTTRIYLAATTTALTVEAGSCE